MEYLVAFGFYNLFAYIRIRRNRGAQKANVTEEQTLASEQEWNEFEITEIINLGSRGTVVSCLAKFKDDSKQALLTLTRKSFPSNKEKILALFASHKFELGKESSKIKWSADILQENDRWSTISLFAPSVNTSGDFDITNMLTQFANITMIYPATQKEIDKARPAQFCQLYESGEAYAKFTKPHVDSIREKANLWLYNILDGLKEKEVELYRDDIFVLGPAPGLKITDKNLNSLKLLGYVQDRSILSLREINQSNINVLIHMMDITLAFIERTYNIPNNKIRVYCHYPPSFYHFHLHFVNITITEAQHFPYHRAYDLRTVIYNVMRDSNYYKNATLLVELKETEPFYQDLLKDQVNVENQRRKLWKKDL